MYKMTVYKAWDGKMLLIRRANNLEYFDRFKGRQNYRIVITKGKTVIYSEL